MNNYLSMYNIFLVDSKNFTFHIENAYLINENNLIISATESIKTHCTDLLTS